MNIYSQSPPALEDFTNSNATASYTNGVFVGNSSILWTYIASRNANGDANNSGISLPALMLRMSASVSKITSSTITGGVSDFSVKLYKGFTGAGNRQVELFINGVSKGTSTPFDDFSEHIFSVTGINVSSDIIIEIVNITSKQIIIDDISWTGYSPPTTTVPDDNFEAYLETHTAAGAVVSVGDANSMGDGIANNNLVTTANISGVIRINLQNQNIADLTGIEDFTSLTLLNCYDNQLSSLDVSAISSLATLKCYNNQITNLNVTQNINLTFLRCESNQLTSLDLTNNTSLNYFYCDNNQLSALDLSNNNGLIRLSAHSNQLTSLTVSNMTNLNELFCQNNQLSNLDVRNGNNTSMSIFQASNNPNLICISVDDANWATTNWTTANGNIDAQTSFSNDCNLDADFSADVTTVCEGATVTFTDASTGNPTSWSWDFGDGTNSTLQNPTHAYANSGTYNVSLTITASGNSNTETKAGYIVVNDSPTVSAGNDQTVCQGSQVTLGTNSNLNNGLLVYYPFNGNANDNSGNTNNGTVSGSVLTTDRFNNANSAYYFDGINDNILASPISSINTSVSVSIWVKNDNNTGEWNGIITNQPNSNEGFLLQENQNNKYNWAVAKGGGYRELWSNSFISNQWDHFVCIIDNNQMSIYINGVLDANSTIGSFNLASTGNLCIGSRYSNEWFKGKLDDIGIWNRALTNQEIQAIYNGATPVNYIWSPAGETTSSITTQPNSTTTYTLTGTASNGCQATDNVTVTVNSPTVSAGSDQTVCQGSNVTLSGSGANSYSWDNGVTDGVAFIPSMNSGASDLPWGPTNVNNTTKNIAVNSSELVSLIINHSDVNQNGYGYVKFTYDDGTVDEFRFWGNGGMRLWNPQTSTFTTANYAVGNHSAAFMNIANSSKQYYIECLTTSGINKWEFRNLNTGLVGIQLFDNANWNGLSNVKISQLSFAKTYTVTGIGANGCSETDNTTITVYPSPTVDLGVDLAVCQGATQTLDAGSGYSYLWSDNSTNQTLDVSTFGIYSVTITDGNNCTANDQINISQETVDVSAGFDQIICENTSITLNGANSHGTICATADEDNPATLTAPLGAVFTNVVFASYGLPTGSCGNFSVGSCHSNTSQSVAEGLLIGQNNVTISASNGVFGDPCVGTRKKLYIEVQWVLNNVNNSYTWNNGVLDGVAFIPTTTNTYTVTGASANNCTATDDVIVTVNPQEDATFTYSASSYCADDSDPSPTISGTAGGTFTA
ncbi:PKD domain-containing protein, partial [Flavobacteriales bacterium]|nr:PKD domain-containing protein [Flavobacteriales bacterium]